MRLPLFIQRRLYPFRNYVSDKLYPAAYIKQITKNKKPDERKIILKNINLIITECSYACFIFSLKQFFEEGTRAAAEAVDVFTGLGIDSFYIGKKDYSKNNINVNEGKELYEIMMNAISSIQLKNLILNSKYYSEIIDRYKDVSI